MKSFISPSLTFTIQVFREGKTFVSYTPELDVASCGSTLEMTKTNLHDAVRGFLKSAHHHGTLRTILEDAGYIRRRDQWYDPELVVLDRFTVPV